MYPAIEEVYLLLNWLKDAGKALYPISKQPACEKLPSLPLESKGIKHAAVVFFSESISNRESAKHSAVWITFTDLQAWLKVKGNIDWGGWKFIFNANDAIDAYIISFCL